MVLPLEGKGNVKGKGKLFLVSLIMPPCITIYLIGSFLQKPCYFHAKLLQFYSCFRLIALLSRDCLSTQLSYANSCPITDQNVHEKCSLILITFGINGIPLDRAINPGSGMLF